jgi:hypothetical protein
MPKKKDQIRRRALDDVEARARLISSEEEHIDNIISNANRGVSGVLENYLVPLIIFRLYIVLFGGNSLLVE